MNEKIGPTGEFPEGKINDEDEGAINVGILQDNGAVVIRFGVPLEWIGMTPEQAIEFANKLIRVAEKINKGM